MNQQGNHPFSTDSLKCRLCRATIMLVMISPVLFYYGYPLFKYYTRHYRAHTPMQWIPLGVPGGVEDIPPCTSYLVDIGTSKPVMAFTPCPESERSKLEMKPLDPATYPLRAPDVTARGGSGAPSVQGKPAYRLPGNVNVPREAGEQAGSDTRDE